MSNPLISVITINLNNGKGLKATVESVLSQTYKNYEFLVIDGASNDSSQEIIKEFSSDFSYWVSEPDRGIYDAMNKGIAKAKGEYLIFLNSGDLLNNKDVFLKISEHLKNAEVISGDLMLEFENKLHHIHSEDAVSIKYFRKISLYHQATFVQRNVFERFGFYNDSFKLAGDYEFFIRVLLREKVSYKHIPVIICTYFTDGISNNPRYLELNMRERKMAWDLNFNPVVLRDLDELYYLKESPFYWIFNKTRKKGFFYYFFSVISWFFLAGYRILEKLRVVK